jgi:hypothetical protein
MLVYRIGLVRRKSVVGWDGSQSPIRIGKALVLPMCSVRTRRRLVPAEGFEPPTYGLQNRCTTTVLSRH